MSEPKGRFKHNMLLADVKRIKSGLRVGDDGYGSSLIVSTFNCNNCSWRGTEVCPKGIADGDVYKKKICRKRVLFLKDNFELAGTIPKYFQREELVKSKILSDLMWKQMETTGELHPDYHKISRNIIILTDKMRRQDEGIKIQGEMAVTMTDLRKTIDAQAKILEGKDIVKEAEFYEKQDKSRGTDEVSEKV